MSRKMLMLSFMITQMVCVRVCPEALRIQQYSNRTKDVNQFEVRFSYYLDVNGDTVLHGIYEERGARTINMQKGLYVHGLKDSIWEVVTDTLFTSRKQSTWKKGVLQGGFYTWFDNTSKGDSGVFIQGRREGAWKEIVDDKVGHVYHGNYKDGRKWGMWHTSYSAGLDKIWLSGEYHRGLPNGLWEWGSYGTHYPGWSSRKGVCFNMGEILNAMSCESNDTTDIEHTKFLGIFKNEFIYLINLYRSDVGWLLLDAAEWRKGFSRCSEVEEQACGNVTGVDTVAFEYAGMDCEARGRYQTGERSGPWQVRCRTAGAEMQRYIWFYRHGAVVAECKVSDGCW